MKRILFLIIFLVLSCNESFSQSKNRLGFVFGLNHFSVRGSSFLDEADSDNGNLIGLTYEYKFNKNFSLVTGLLMQQKKLGYNDAYTFEFFDNDGFYTFNDYTIKTTNNYQFYQIPLLIRYNFGKNNSFFVNGGFFWAFTGSISRRTKITNVTEDYSYNVSTDYNNNFLFADRVGGIDSGITFGLGKSFMLAQKVNLSIELRDDLGLQNSISGLNTNGISGTIKTNTLSLLFQLSFDL
jgi:hypothetical protein